MRLLFIGDIVARTGRDLVRRGVRPLVERHAIDSVIANAENAAGGAGITREIANELLGAGIHVLTSGNHVWDKRERPRSSASSTSWVGSSWRRSTIPLRS
jgi:calcineurin-like phosphoesterase